MRLRTLTPDAVDQRIAHVEQLAADGLRQALTSVTQAFDDRSSIVLAAALPGSRIWGALQEIFSVWRRTVEDKIMPYLKDTWQTAADDVTAQIRVDWPDYEAPPRAGDLMYEYLRRAENHMVGLSTELWENTRAALAEGVDAGEGIAQLAARVTAAADVTDFRARAVARTETARAAEAGSYDTIVAAGLTGMKEWVATEDDRTRPAHKLADGQRQPINDLYVLYDPPALARYPVDWVLPASQSANCRCTSVYDVDDEAIVASLTAFRFNPRQPRDDDGKWTDGPPGTNLVDDLGRLPDGSVPTRDEFGGDDPTDPARDKLGLAGRIRLAGGERLLSSGAVNADEGAFVMAVIDTPQGRRLRIGQVAREDKKAWRADPGGEDAEDEETGERFQRPPVGSTAELDEAGISSLWDALERAADELPATLKRYNADAREVRKREAAGGPQEPLHPEDDGYEVLDETITGTRWGDVKLLAHLAEGDEADDGGPVKGRPAFYLTVQERDDQAQDSDLLTLRGVQNMLKMLDTLVADTGELTAGGALFAGFRAWRQAYDLARRGAR